MPTTLVLGGPRSGKSRHAETLLADGQDVLLVRTVETPDLVRALIAARQPVLVEDLATWLRSLLDSEDLWTDPDRAHAVVDERLDELTVALAALPFDVVVVSPDTSAPPSPDVPAQDLYVDLLSRVNQRVSAAVPRVHLTVAGRVLDLSAAPPLGIR